MENNIINLKANLDLSELDEAVRKTDQLVETLKEANSLACELASKEISPPMEVISRALIEGINQATRKSGKAPLLAI